MEFSADDQAFLLKTTCRIVRRRLEGSNAAMHVTPPSLPLSRPAGCFVSLHSRVGHALRGCIGRIDTASPLLEALVPAAHQVGADPRFANNPVTVAELPSLSVELSILGPLKPAASPLDFNPPVDGIYLTVAGKAGIFLPQVARETGWSREQLLDRLCQEKLGVPPRAWQDPSARLFTFATVTIGPADFIFDATTADPVTPKS